MNINTFKQAIPFLFKANVPAFVWGWHGVGKSTVPKQWCKENGWKFFDFRLNTQADVGDFLGLMDFVRDANGNIYATKHFTPQWLVDAIEYCNEHPESGALIYLDELNRAARFDMVGPVFQMSLDKRLHTVEFPDNLKLMVASNPNTEDYNVLNLDDKALLDRFCHIKLTPSRKEFIDYMRDTGKDQRIIDFLLENQKFIEESDDLEDFSLDEFAKPSRRTWAEYVDALLKVETPMPVMKELNKGMVGLTISTAFFKALENDDKPLTPGQILDNYKKHKKKVEKLMSAKDGVRSDLFKVSSENLIDHLKKQGDKVITKKQGENLIDYIFDIPRDYMVTLMRTVFILPSCMPFFQDSQYRRKELIEMVRLTRGKKVEGDNNDNA